MESVTPSGWLDKENMTFIHNETLFSPKKKEMLSKTQMNLESRGHYAKWNKLGTEKQSLHLYVQSKKSQTERNREENGDHQGLQMMGIAEKC